MTDKELEQMLKETIDTLGFAARDELEDMCLPENHVHVSSVGTFEEHGILTTDLGLVVKTDDGNEYQLTIVQSR